tara:strand:+ start:485697 stop:487034 length:1338 start_codon:yes stop_codon:yes gene_type:complete
MTPKTLEKLEQLSPADFEATLNDATTLHESGKLIEAHHLYKELLAQQPKHARLLFLKAVALYQMDRVDEALPFIEQAVALDALNPDILNAYGLIRRNMRQFDEAKDIFEQIIKLRPQSYEALNNLGLVYGDQYDWEKASEYFKKALELSPDEPEVMLNLAHALRDNNQAEEGLVYYKKLHKMFPDNARHAFNVAIVLHGLGRFDEAIEYLEKVLKINPDDINAKHLLEATRGDKGATEAPESYIADLFDAYAKDFDMHLAALEYQVPKMLAARIPFAIAPKGKPGSWNMLDLGCGTGACGLYFNEYCARRVAVDLSPKMIEKSQAHGVYDDLHTQGIEGFYAESDELFDLIFATDVLVYVGALESFMEESAKHLKPGGLLAVSTELCTPEEGDFILRNSGRFAQSDAYMLKLAKANGLMKMVNADITVRMGHHEPIPGKLYIFKK